MLQTFILLSLNKSQSRIIKNLSISLKYETKVCFSRPAAKGTEDLGKRLANAFQVEDYLCFKTRSSRNLLNENRFDLHKNKHASETQFHLKGFTSISFSRQMLISIRNLSERQGIYHTDYTKITSYITIMCFTAGTIIWIFF